MAANACLASMLKEYVFVINLEQKAANATLAYLEFQNFNDLK